MRRTSTYASRTESDCGLCYNQQRNRRAEISAKISKENGDGWCRSSALTQRRRQTGATQPVGGRVQSGADCTEAIDSTIGYSKPESYGAPLMRSLGVRGGRESVGQGPGRIKKNRQFLAKPTDAWYCFSELPIGPASVSHRRRGRDFGAKSRERLGNRPVAPRFFAR
jgi:hypothetical protein